MQQHIALYRCIVTVCEPLQGDPLSLTSRPTAEQAALQPTTLPMC